MDWQATSRLNALAASGMMTACLLAAACGGGGSSPSAPTSTTTSPAPTTGGGTGSAPSATATIRITASGVEPKEVTIAVGGRVTFVSSASRSHDVSSDPHPAHTECPPINTVNVLSPGQSRDTGTFTQARRCGFHDHNDPNNDSLRGTIVIQ